MPHFVYYDHNRTGDLLQVTDKALPDLFSGICLLFPGLPGIALFSDADLMILFGDLYHPFQHLSS